MRTRIIGLGNTILRDDGVGIHTVRELARRLAESDRLDTVEICETEVAGFSLMELLAGCERAILVDSIQFDNLAPGSVLQLDPSDLRTSLRLRSVHEIDLPTVLSLGNHLGLPMPRHLSIFAIQAEDGRTFGTCLTQPVQGGMEQAVHLILQLLDCQ